MTEEPKKSPKGRWLSSLRDPTTWIVAAIAAIVVAIFLEYLVKPGFVYFANISLNVMSHISLSWTNAIYHDAVGDVTAVENFEFWMIFTSALVITGMVIAFRWFSRRIPTSLNRATDAYHSALLLGSLMLMALMMLSALVSGYQMINIKNTYERRILVLSSAVSEQDRRSLEAQWGNVETRNDFDTLMKRMRVMAMAHNLRLPPNEIVDGQ